MKELEPGCELDGGKYRIVRLIGRGGMGCVYEAIQREMHKRVAIKCLSPAHAGGAETAERLLREARATARIRHPNVVDIYDVGRDDSTVFLVMEYLEGEPLSQALARGNIPPYEVIALLLAAMRGVAAAHVQGVVHRDIKPDNIFLARVADMANSVPKVLDFGISKVDARNGTEQMTLTRDGTTVGTPSYMSYEQLTGERAIDGRADVYGFGVILYEALTGRVPFEADSFPELMVRFATTVPVDPKALRPEIPGTLSRLMLWALKRNRDERIGSIDTLIRELEPFASRHGFVAELTALSPNATTSEPPRAATPWREHSEGSVRGSVPAHHMTSSRQAAAVRSRAPLAAAAIALLALGAASVFYFTRSSEPPAETSVSAATRASETVPPIDAPPPAAAVRHVTPERPQPRPTTTSAEEGPRSEPTAPATAGTLPRIVETPNRSRQSAVQPARPARATGPKPRDLGIY